jgi:hypothetical protein
MRRNRVNIQAMKREIKAIIGQYVEEMGTGNRFEGIHERNIPKLVEDLKNYIKILETKARVKR